MLSQPCCPLLCFQTKRICRHLLVNRSNQPSSIHRWGQWCSDFISTAPPPVCIRAQGDCGGKRKEKFVLVQIVFANLIQDMSDRFEEIRRESGFSGNYIPVGRQLPRTPPLTDVIKHLDFCSADEDCENMEVRAEYYWSSHISYWLEIKKKLLSSRCLSTGRF